VAIHLIQFSSNTVGLLRSSQRLHILKHDIYLPHKFNKMNKKNNIDQSPKSREGIRNIEFNFEEKSELFFKLSRILNKENRITI